MKVAVLAILVWEPIFGMGSAVAISDLVDQGTKPASLLGMQMN